MTALDRLDAMPQGFDEDAEADDLSIAAATRAADRSEVYEATLVSTFDSDLFSDVQFDARSLFGSDGRLRGERIA